MHEGRSEHFPPPRPRQVYPVLARGLLLLVLGVLAGEPDARAAAASAALDALPAAAAPSAADGLPAAGAPSAIDVNGQMKDPALQVRFERIAADLRCLVCQNESIADSNADLANDLRRQVREMLAAGKSDAAIFDFMTDRYGEFVRFNPPLEPKTLLIWGAPFLVLLGGAGIVYRIVRLRSRMPLDDDLGPA